MTKNTEEEGPYMTILASDFHTEAGFFGVYVIRDGKRVAEHLGRLNIIEADVIRNELNAAWLAGRSSATAVPLSPDMVEKIMEVVDDVCSFDNWSVPQIQRLRTRLLGIR